MVTMSTTSTARTHCARLAALRAVADGVELRLRTRDGHDIVVLESAPQLQTHAVLSTRREVALQPLDALALLVSGKVPAEVVA